MGTTANDLAGRISLYLNQSVSLLLNIISPNIADGETFPLCLLPVTFWSTLSTEQKKWQQNYIFRPLLHSKTIIETVKSQHRNVNSRVMDLRILIYNSSTRAFFHSFEQWAQQAIVWNYNTNRFKNSFMKFYWIWYDFGVDRDSLQRRKQNIFHYQTTK